MKWDSEAMADALCLRLAGSELEVICDNLRTADDAITQAIASLDVMVHHDADLDPDQTALMAEDWATAQNRLNELREHIEENEKEGRYDDN